MEGFVLLIKNDITKVNGRGLAQYRGEVAANPPTLLRGLLTRLASPGRVERMNRRWVEETWSGWLMGGEREGKGGERMAKLGMYTQASTHPPFFNL